MFTGTRYRLFLLTVSSWKRKNRRGRKKVKRVREVGKVTADRIGSLPDAVLEHILSYLPFEEAVKTSVLSKRWRNLWMSCPDLYLVEQPEKRSLFLDIVERLVGTQKPTRIKRFGLTCKVMSDSPRITKWVRNAVSRGVENLSLSLQHEAAFVLPPCLFTCESLENLWLSLPFETALPSHIWFSSLKRLDIRDVVFPDDHSTQKLFSGCPVLEELDIYNCRWRNVKAVSISSPLLRELNISDHILGRGDDFDDQGRVHCCKFLIRGGRLDSFSLYGDLRYNYCLLDSPSLIEASIEVKSTWREFMPDRTIEDALRLFELIRGASNVKNLTLSCEVIEALTDAEELYREMPVLSNLTHLQLTTWTIDIASEGLFILLHNSPCLDTIEFTEGLKLETYNEVGEWIIDHVPSCFSTHLKTIVVDHFAGTKEERDAVELLLKHATCLERIILDIFTFDIGAGPTRLKEVLEHLKSLSNRVIRFSSILEPC